MSNAERLGAELSEVASWAVVSGTIQATLRDGRDLTKAISKLVLFGNEAMLKVRAGDPPVIQVLKQMAADYQRLRDDPNPENDGRAANDLLINIGRQLTSLEQTKGNHLGIAFKLLAEQARMQAKAMEKNPGGPTASDLEDILRKSGAQGMIRAAEIADDGEE